MLGKSSQSEDNLNQRGYDLGTINRRQKLFPKEKDSVEEDGHLLRGGLGLEPGLKQQITVSFQQVPGGG